MKLYTRSVEFLWIIVVLSENVAAALTICHGHSPEEGNKILPCNATIYQPVCLLCNASKSSQDLSWFAEDKRLSDGKFNFNASYAGGLAINFCLDPEHYSLKLKSPSMYYHNSVYYCRRDKEILSTFLLNLHADAHLWINMSSEFNGTLHLSYNESNQTLQCIITTAVPPVVLTWSLNNASQRAEIFNGSSKEPTIFNYTTTFNNLKTGDTVTCSSKGLYITSDYTSLKVYVHPKEKGNSNTKDRWPTTASPNEQRQEYNLYKIYLPAGLIAVALFGFSALIIHSRNKKQNSFSISPREDVTRNEFSTNNAESNGSIYGPYSLIGDAVRRDGESHSIVTTSLTSKLKVSGIYEYWTGTYSADGDKDEKCLAKSLSGQATLQEASQFQDLARNLKLLNESTYLVRLLCINVEENPFSVVYELMEYGTLRDMVMSRYQQPSTSALDTEATSLTTQIRELVSFATNVANAMLFLESQNFRHPVLSLKKVLLTSQCCCKLYDIYPSDMAMTKIEEVRKKNHPPIAWMSPETIFLRQYSQTSDVWSFSTLLWELFSLGRIPYAGNQDKDIEEKIRRGVLLKQPPNCPRAVYGTMLLAWAKSSANRPSFEVIIESLEGVFKSIEKGESTEPPQYFTLEANHTNEYI
ncbi:Fibroblast growth factor receptor 4 [Holothuria leucospilota]|uniref:Fibroblast growth factor receptor 4 n=1 Tax=Holothuria leucospilota TaxID=206669 RepID=A0A9Q1BXY4_HOLLE|nr:Fibroblast growth factor receptor 4 [Holothuria leucospilota]